MMLLTVKNRSTIIDEERKAANCRIGQSTKKQAIIQLVERCINCTMLPP
jgi:hypothetical protein